jgi:hypothetical protein
MWQKFIGNGVFVFSDPAGAKACLALNEILNIEQVQGNRKLYSNKNYSFYKQFESDVEIVFIENITDISDKFDWIFTGTSHPQSSGGFELLMLNSITAKNSFSFIDHWTNFKLRFTLDDKIILPATIFVVDEKAKQLAINDGLPEKDLFVFENPYLIYLKKYKQSFVSRNFFCNTLDISLTKKIILYAPDPISLRSSDERNEILVLEELIEICDNTITLLLKLHPLQPLGVIGKIIETNPHLKLIDDNVFLPQDVFKNVDCIIGFYSNYLLEASTINKNIIRYILNNNQIDYLAHSLGSNSIVVNNKKELNFAIKNSCA